MMQSAEYDYNFLVTKKHSCLVSTFVEAMKEYWPDAVVDFAEDGVKDESYDFVIINRDKDMEEKWDWQISTDLEFSGEGQVQLQNSAWGFQEIEILVRRHLTKSPAGFEIEDDYDSTLISSDLRVISLCLPWDIKENEFCAKVYSRLKECITDAAKL